MFDALAQLPALRAHSGCEFLHAYASGCAIGRRGGTRTASRPSWEEARAP